MKNFSRSFMRSRRQKLNFESSDSGNYLHEVVFLSNYLHDAEFRPKELRVHAGELTIPLDRDCWEYPLRQPDGSLYLFGCRSELVISGVRELRWSRTRLPGSVMIGNVFCGERFYREPRSGHLVFYSADSGIRLSVHGREPRLRFTLRDLEMPQ